MQEEHIGFSSEGKYEIKQHKYRNVKLFQRKKLVL